MFQTQEALQDSMLGLKEAMEAITKSEGKKIERVLSLETKGLFLFFITSTLPSIPLKIEEAKKNGFYFE